MKALAAAIILSWTAALAAHEGHGGRGVDQPKAVAKVPARAKAGLAVSAAMSPAGALWLVGLNPDNRLFVQTSTDLGGTWSGPRLLDTGSDKIAADGENRPKIAFGQKNQAVISYTQPLPKPYTGEIRMLRSDDGGASFSLPFTVHQDRQVITHRFESIMFDARGILHTVWIDKRDQVLAAREAGGDGKRSNYRGAAIYRNESPDGGRSFGPDLKVADHSCECCRIALAPAPDGGVAAIWRHVFAPNIRDHAFAILGAATVNPVRASFDEWRLDACPHHGPGLTPAAGGGYHAVWFGEKAGRAAVRYGRLTAGGQPLGEARELPDARAEHADVLATGDQVVIAWRSFDGERTRLRAWTSNDKGSNFILRELAVSGDENDHPRLLATPAGIHVLWRTAKETHVHPVLP